MAHQLEGADQGDGMDELSKLAQKYGADKWGKHHYTPVYFDLFKDKRLLVKKVLEIGVGEGASLFMWREFFPNAIIYGGEIDQKRVDKLQGLDRIKVVQCNQRSEDDLIDLIDQIGGDIDFIIDDGSHRPQDQVFTCLKIMPFLTSASEYVIEDVADERIEEQIPSRYDVAVKKVGKRYDDRLIFVKKHV